MIIPLPHYHFILVRSFLNLTWTSEVQIFNNNADSIICVLNSVREKKIKSLKVKQNNNESKSLLSQTSNVVYVIWSRTIWKLTEKYLINLIKG